MFSQNLDNPKHVNISLIKEKENKIFCKNI
jgi:hypothetical protein